MSRTRIVALALYAAVIGGSGASADTPAVTTTTTTTTAPVVEKMICKSHVETGSLVARKKTCLTKSQWKYLNEENEAAARKMVEDNQSRPSGN